MIFGSGAFQSISSEVKDSSDSESVSIIPIVTQEEYKRRRKLRKLYLDSKWYTFKRVASQFASNSTPNTTLTSTLYNTCNATTEVPITCAERRRLRKLYLSNKRSITPSGSSSKQNLSSSADPKSIDTNTHNVTRTPSVLPTSNVGCVRSNSAPHTNIVRFSLSSNLTATNSISPILQKSTIPRLSLGNCKLVRKARVTSPIPMIDLSTEETIVEDPYKGVSQEYLDHGDQCITCDVCNAKLWDSEKGRGKHEDGKTSYSLCCGYSKVELPDYKDTRPNYEKLFRCVDKESKHVLKNIRRYNSMFAFTSMGGKVDPTVNRGNAPFCYRISGENYHTIGSLLPENGSKPKFCQLYIYDTENELSNRQSIFSSSKDASSSSAAALDRQLIEHIKDVLDTDNQLVKSYRMVRDSFQDNPQLSLKLRLIGRREKDGRTYNLPTAGEVAALIVGDLDSAIDSRDIVVETQTGDLKRISELHPSYLALQYPILFPHGDDGYRVDIPHRGVVDVTNKKRPNCTMREFFAYRVQDRINQFSLILNSRRLFQQFLVDAYTMIETERLNYIRQQQKNLRSDTYDSLQKLRNNDQQDISKAGKSVMLPSSFTGGARYMMQNYLDAMSLCKCFGYPDFFITITCNPKWPEVTRFLRDTTLKPEDRPDILSRLFKLKLDAICKDLKERHLLGKAAAFVYTIEFQKRGLPHAHLCLFMENEYKLPTVDHVDAFICAEIPNRNDDPELYTLVKDYMIHGPCGLANLSCPCMVDRKCSKGFPKKFQDHMTLDSNGFPVYRRRNDGDNQNEEPSKDEIKEYYDCRYISACEASWRIFSNEVHYRYPSVTMLPFHLPGQQNVVFGPDEDINSVLNKPSVKASMFLSWMERNKDPNDTVARTLTYVQFPIFYVWKIENRCWEPRQKGKAIGRIHSVSPSFGEAYFLRILLNKVKGPKSFADIRTVNGHVHDTFRDACYALGLLDDDTEYIEAIKEANETATCSYIHVLFAMMLLSNTLSRPEVVWESTWKYMTDDFIYRLRKFHQSEALLVPEDHLKNYALGEIEKFLLRNNSSLRRFLTMPYPDEASSADSQNRLIYEERCYTQLDRGNEYERQMSMLNDEQLSVFEEILKAVDGDAGGVFFVYGYGGTGKTFLWKTLSATIRSKGQIVLNVASSGIASLLLTGGRTAHSRFHIPLNLTEDSVCHIKPDSDTARLLCETKLIIWDEAPMVHKHTFEALDRTMNDIFNMDTSIGSEISFGGKLLRLTKNLRLTIGRSTSEIEDINNFAKWLLDLGEGNVGCPNDGEASIQIPPDLLINDTSDPISSLIDFVYPSILDNYNNHNYFSERAILAPKNEVVHEINDRLLALFPGEEREYLSSDSLCQTENPNSTQLKLYSPDVLNGLKVSGLPNHRLVLKVGVPIKRLYNRVIEAEIISGGNIGTRTYIPRLNLIPSDKKIPFAFQRRQFPIAVCFAMTINKSQWQSLSRIGLYVRQPVFTHGQLYVALSTVKSRDGVKLLILDKDGKPTDKTSNVVCKEVFNKL
ncbi:uncharacterized protein LOC110888292 [Helianthus annuus]|uniref:uncharacterized protein LOC110888292 n=1 Tax=Helianthus annuus TaxID=4232 RepID=UPI0016533EED|nr:uncharacterized protein LOC110888292 [Helianthus annuus]